MRNSKFEMCGLCLKMCPPNEIIMRQKNALIHILETDNPWSSDSTATNLLVCQKQLRLLVANPAKMVKSYSRSAADKKILPEDVRPFKVLNDTTDYLLKQ